MEYVCVRRQCGRLVKRQNSSVSANANKANPSEPPDVLTAELARTPSKPPTCVLRDESPTFRSDPRRCHRHTLGHESSRIISRDEMVATERPVPALLAVSSRSSAAWSRRSTQLLQFPRCSHPAVTDSSRPPSAQ